MAWLSTFLIQLLTPIVEKIIGQLELSARLSAIEKNQQATIEVFDQLRKAETDEQRNAALDNLSKSWNHP